MVPEPHHFIPRDSSGDVLWKENIESFSSNVNISKDISKGEVGVDCYILTSSSINKIFSIFHVKFCIFIIHIILLYHTYSYNHILNVIISRSYLLIMKKHSVV